MKRRSLGRALTLSAAAGAAVYVAIACYVGVGKLGSELRAFAWPAALAALGLALVNYGLRFAKWELFLRRLGVRVALGHSLKVFLAGFSLTVTPGKVGEVVKAYLLRETDGVPMARTAPIVVAERVTDLLALLLLALIGIGVVVRGGGQRLLWAAAGLIVVFLALASSKRLVHALIDLAARVPAIGRAAPKLREFYDAMAELVRPAPLIAATLLSLGAWLAECVGFWVVLGGFPGAGATLAACTFIYAAMTIAGALSFLPGGLLVQEGGMVGLLIELGHGIGRPLATAATFVIRLCTLWFAVAIGVVAMMRVSRRPLDLEALGQARETSEPSPVAEALSE